MPWDRVHDEAEVLEHYISEELEERIATALGDPDRDPHGDPIPDRDLTITDPPEGAAARARGREWRRSSRGSPTDAPRCSASSTTRGIRPGVELRVLRREPFGGALVVATTAASTPIGPDLAARMLVDPARGRLERAAAGPGPERERETDEVAAVERLSSPARRASPTRPGARSRASGAGSPGSGRSSAPPSSPRSPTSIPATSPRTSPPAPSSATCCSGSSSRPT